MPTTPSLAVPQSRPAGSQTDSMASSKDIKLGGGRIQQIWMDTKDLALQSAAFERFTELAEELIETCMHLSSGTPRTFSHSRVPLYAALWPAESSRKTQSLVLMSLN